MQKSLRTRKQDLVRDAIHETAIKLFADKGFDQTTVEEVAQAAGVSRRSFFRYFASKDDLLAQNVVDYGAVLIEAAKSAPLGIPPIELLRHTVEAGIQYSKLNEAMTRQVVGIAARSLSARQAHLSRMMLVEDALAEAFASRKRNTSLNYMEPRLLAGVTFAVMNATIASWFLLEQKDLHIAAKRALNYFLRIFSETDQHSASVGTQTVRTPRKSTKR